MQKIFKIVGWLYRFSYKTGKDRVRAHSAEAGFFIIMSVFPIVMLLLALLRYTPLTADEIVLTFEGLTPFEITPLVQPMVNSIYRQSTSLVPWTVLVALWTAGKGMLGLSDGLNSIYQVEETRNYFVTRFRCACYTVVMILALVVSLGILVFGYGIENYLLEKFPFLMKYQDSMSCFLPGWHLLYWRAFCCTIYVSPKPEDGVYPPAAGAVFTSVAWAVFSYVFSIYLEYASNMSVLYGSLTTLVVVMLWLYFCMYLLFIGAEINQYLSAPELFTLDR